jgi:dTMP kinase
VSSPGRYAATGVFVCFEGGEGSGKSTQARLLADRLRETGFEVLLTFEPGDTPVGKEIRRIVLDPATGHLTDHTEALLYAADKAEHVEKVVTPALDRGAVVITDRYVDTALAYQGVGRGLDAAELESVLRWATGDLRLGRFEGRDRIEAESVEFHRRARQAFLDIAAADPDHYLVLDAAGDVDEIASAVHERLTTLLDDDG